MTTVLQPWVEKLPMMQQTVLMTAIRGPDGLPKYGNVKYLLRWYRRCILYTAMDHVVLDNPYDKGGGSFTGPSFNIDIVQDWEENPDWYKPMNKIVSGYLTELDAIPLHFQLHFMHGVEILGYKHPRHGAWWLWLYERLVKDMHLNMETKEELDFRLGDNEAQWRQTADEATQK